MRGRSVFLLLVAVLLTVGLTGCATSSSSSTPAQVAETAAAIPYTCCQLSALSSADHPGEVLRLRWSLVPSPKTARPEAGIAFFASLRGPYASAGVDRGSDPQPVVARAAVTHSSANPDAAPGISVLTIPANAQPGYYRLRTTAKSSFDTFSQAVTIRVD